MHYLIKKPKAMVDRERICILGRIRRSASDYVSMVLTALYVVLLAGCSHTTHNPSPPTAPRNVAVPGKPVVAGPGKVNPTLLAAWQPTPVLFEEARHVPDRVALTFDAGTDDSGVATILRILAARHIHITFFLTGQFCEENPRSCRAIAEAGMEIGNHSYSHPYFTKQNRDAICKQLIKGEAAITKACGRGAKPLFRFPYGDSDWRTQKIVAAAGYQPIGWTLDSLDAVGKLKPTKFVADRIISKIKPGSVTLMHVSRIQSALALEPILDYLDKKHLRVVPVSELLIASPPRMRKVTSIRP